jgi:hypothetical protein
MAAAGKAGAFEIRDMAIYFPSLTAAAQGLGQKGVPAVADLAAALQITRKGTGDSAAAATNLQNLFQKIMSPETVKNFHKLGIDLPKALKKAAAESKSPIEAITELTNKALGGNDKKIGDLGRLGFIFSDSQVQQALRPLIQNIDEYRRIRATALGAQGVVDIDFAERMKDAAEAAKAFQVQQKALADTMGALLLPAATKFLKKVTELAAAIGGWANRHPELAKNLAILVAVLGGLLIVAGAAAIAIAGIMAPFAAFGAVARLLGTTGAGMLLRFFGVLFSPLRLIPLLIRGMWMLATAIFDAGMFMLANPIVAAIVVIVAILAFAGYWIYRHWDAIKAAFAAGIAYLSGLWAQFTGFGANLMQGLIDGITGKISALRSKILSIGQSVAGWFRSVLGIHSPSRVFAGFGSNIVAGLNQGLDQRRLEPVQRIQSLSGKLVSAMAIGAAAPAAAAGPAPAAMSAPAPSIVNHYAITIHGARLGDEQDLESRLRAALDRIERGHQARGRSSFRDHPDYED